LLHPLQVAGVLQAHAEGRHRDGHRAARNLYGAIIVLAVLVTAEGNPAGPFVTAIVLALTVAVVLGMDAYADVIALEITLRRPLTGAERIARLRDLVVVTFAAEAPLLFFVLAGVGLVSEEFAFTLAKGTTLALLFGYGFLARRLAGRSFGAAVSAGLVVAGIGLALAFGKGYVHL
jgi:hypothetical protein